MTSARGITLIEVLVATAVLGVLGVATLQASAVAAMLRRSTAERLDMSRECEALLDTAMAMPYDDLVVAEAEGSTQGPLGGTQSPRGVQTVGGTRGGQAVTTSKRMVISYVDPANPTRVVTSDMGIKRILVQITRGGRTVARVYALRSRAADEALP